MRIEHIFSHHQVHFRSPIWVIIHPLILIIFWLLAVVDRDLHHKGQTVRQDQVQVVCNSSHPDVPAPFRQTQVQYTSTADIAVVVGGGGGGHVNKELTHLLPFQLQSLLMVVVMVDILMVLQETLVDLVVVTGILVILLVKEQTIRTRSTIVPILVEHKEEVITGQVAAVVVPVLLVQIMVLPVLLVVT